MIWTRECMCCERVHCARRPGVREPSSPSFRSKACGKGDQTSEGRRQDGGRISATIALEKEGQKALNVRGAKPAAVSIDSRVLHGLSKRKLVYTSWHTNTYLSLFWDWKSSLTATLWSKVITSPNLDNLSRRGRVFRKCLLPRDRTSRHVRQYGLNGLWVRRWSNDFASSLYLLS